MASDEIGGPYTWRTKWARPALVATYVILAIMVVLSLYPFLMMIINSFKSDSEILRNPAALPTDWTLASFTSLFTYHGGAWVNFLNGLIVSCSSTAIAVLMTAMAAYAFTKYKFFGRDVIFTLLMLTLMVPSQITIPPLYLLFAKIGWLNTLQVQIVPTITSVFGLFMVRQYMQSLPNELIEAARIDGAGHWQVFWMIILPISAPILGAFAILHFLGVWNSYLWPLIVANDPSVQPIMVTLPNMTDPNVGFLPVWGTIMAGCTLATLPILVVFVIFQDRFMASATVGAVKS
jgi:ABC-type glycerol-3-phosphate transport system permease component